MKERFGVDKILVDENIAKVSIVGTGMKSSPGVAARAFTALADNHINILMISTSPIRISVVVEKSQVEAAVRCLHTAFGLDSDSIFEETQLSPRKSPRRWRRVASLLSRSSKTTAFFVDAQGRAAVRCIRMECIDTTRR